MARKAFGISEKIENNVPVTFVQKTEISKPNESPERTAKKKKSSGLTESQKKAINREAERISLVEEFQSTLNIESSNPLVKIIYKYIKNPRTKNIKIEDFEKQLQLIIDSIDSIGYDKTLNKFQENMERGYLRMYYENQVLPYATNTTGKKKGNFNNNVELQGDNETAVNPRLSMFDGYRRYLVNPDDDNELIKFLEKKFNIYI